MNETRKFVIESVDPLDSLTLKQRQLLVSLRDRGNFRTRSLQTGSAVYRLRPSSGRGRRWFVVAAADPELRPGVEVLEEGWVAAPSLALVEDEPVEVVLALAARLRPAAPAGD